MTAQVTIRPDEYRRVIRRLNELDRDTRDFTPATRKIAGFLHERTLRTFDTERAPDGTPWKPLAPATVREKRKARYGEKILQRTRNLRDSIHPQNDYRSAVVGTNEDYAAIHQFGGEIKRSARQQVLAFAASGGRFTSRRNASRRRGKNAVVSVRFAAISAHTIEMPARPFLGAAPSDADEMLDIIQRHLAR